MDDIDKALDLLTKGIKKYKSTIEALESDIEEKDVKIEDLEDELNEIKSRFELD